MYPKVVQLFIYLYVSEVICTVVERLDVQERHISVIFL